MFAKHEICCLVKHLDVPFAVLQLVGKQILQSYLLKGVQFSSCLSLFWSLKILFLSRLSYEQWGRGRDFFYSSYVICFLWLMCINMGCKDSTFQLQRNTSWAKSVNCTWNRTNPSCLSFLPADSCTAISFVLLAAKTANPWVLEYIKKSTPEGCCFLNSYLAILVLEEREKQRWGLIFWKPE